MQFRCASCGLGLIERGILHLKRAYFGIAKHHGLYSKSDYLRQEGVE